MVDKITIERIMEHLDDIYVLDRQKVLYKELLKKTGYHFDNNKKRRALFLKEERNRNTLPKNQDKYFELFPGDRPNTEFFDNLISIFSRSHENKP